MTLCGNNANARSCCTENPAGAFLNCVASKKPICGALQASVRFADYTSR
jgi:hypothetical protein